MLDGKIAIDLTAQDRATLTVVASNGQGLFSEDEVAAAAKTLQVRFDDAVSPYVVIARHTGDYAAPYDAALGYLNKAGADERATAAWKNQYQAVLDGLAAAKSAFGKAPDTGNPDDPVRALLGQTSSTGSQSVASDSAGVTSQARAMLDAQANAARDNGTELTFDRSRSSGQQADYTDFDNRSLASIALNQTGDFSAQEIRSAKGELDQRNRASILAALNGSQSGGDTRSTSLALLKQIAGMSDEEKSVMGYTDAFVETHRAKLPHADVAAGSGRIEFGNKLPVPALERFQAKWKPVRVEKTRQIKIQSPVSIQSKRGSRPAQATFSSFCRQRDALTSGGISVSGKLVFQSVTPTSPR